MYSDKKDKVTVLNLITNEEFMYMDIEPAQALISQYMLDNGQSSMVSDPYYRGKHVKSLSVGHKTISLGNLGVMR